MICIFRNLRTGVEGVVSDDAARNTFVINLEATELINKNPIIENLIRSLNLKFDKLEDVAGMHK
jgi:hypothetical protein